MSTWVTPGLVSPRRLRPAAMLSWPEICRRLRVGAFSMRTLVHSWIGVVGAGALVVLSGCGSDAHTPFDNTGGRDASVGGSGGGGGRGGADASASSGGVSAG